MWENVLHFKCNTFSQYFIGFLPPPLHLCTPHPFFFYMHMFHWAEKYFYAKSGHLTELSIGPMTSFEKRQEIESSRCNTFSVGFCWSVGRKVGPKRVGPLPCLQHRFTYSLKKRRLLERKIFLRNVCHHFEVERGLCPFY